MLLRGPECFCVGVIWCHLAAPDSKTLPAYPPILLPESIRPIWTTIYTNICLDKYIQRQVLALQEFLLHSLPLSSTFCEEILHMYCVIANQSSLLKTQNFLNSSTFCWTDSSHPETDNEVFEKHKILKISLFIERKQQNFCLMSDLKMV